MLNDVDAAVLALKKGVEEAKIAETARSLRTTSDALAAAGEQIDTTARSYQPLRKDFQQALAALRKASEAFGELSRQLERQPNAVIFGRTPESTPGLRR